MNWKSSVIVGILLTLCFWVPARASTTVSGVAVRPAAGSEIDLRLDEALASGRLSFPLFENTDWENDGLGLDRASARDSGALEGSQTASLRFPRSHLSWPSLQETAQPEPTPEVVLPEKKWGRWLRKHWYVAVLAGAAVYALIDELDDPVRLGFQ